MCVGYDALPGMFSDRQILLFKGAFENASVRPTPS
jgi:hypothetical protein